ncbi:carboxypeptidase regulatory-like domain-containing protein [Caulifigura coniformis]|nr:carboxypeptidase regulatory-like domain-containing protein [Caulifigura coniformis]
MAGLPLAGCSKSEFELAGVTGVVSCDGRPLPKANVVFQPNDGVGTTSIGFTNDAGEYELVFSRKEKGAIVGGHEVQINVWPTEENPRPIRLPARYNTATELKAEVIPGANTFNFDLATDKSAKRKS